MSYAAPTANPFNAGSSSMSSGYTPTTVPTAGQPLLLNGKMLVYPSGWRGCPKCHDTGYKQNDPTHPCRKCWQSYGQTFNPLLISSSNLQGAKVLQKPLYSTHGSSGMQPNHMSGGWAQNGFARYPSSSHHYQQQQQPRPQYTGQSFPSTSSHTSYQPPSQPPAPALPPRRSPPRVSRADEAREDKDDEDGEAPPAYADAVAAGPSVVLPPQRRDENGNLLFLTSTTAISPQMSGNSHTSGPPHNSPMSPTHLPGSYPPPQQQQYYQPHLPPNHQAGYNHPGQWPQQHPSGPVGGGHAIPTWGAPPPGALVLRPGDPRIGGQLCFKCGGAGVRESLFFGDETCSRCNGSGRVF